MRLGLRLINTDATVNNFNHVDVVSIARGETTDFYFQLVDEEKDGLRYCPAAGATVRFTIPRADQVFPDVNNTRKTVNNGLDRPATQAFSGDSSIWKVSLSDADTSVMVSGAIKVIVTEGSNKKIASLTSAIRIIDGQDE